MTDLDSVLSRLGLSQYLDKFVAEGFETWDTVLDITEEDLVALEVKRGHRRVCILSPSCGVVAKFRTSLATPMLIIPQILQREIASARGLSSDHLLHASTRNTPTEDRPFEPEDKTSSPKGDGSKTGTGPGVKRKYRRHPKADENAPDRPPSAYVIFSNKTREELRGQSLSFTEIAKLVGEKWQVLSPADKEPFETQATQAKEKYHAALAEYKKTDSYREYCQYLADFKAKYSVQQAEGKRAKLEKHPSTGSSGSGAAAEGPSDSPRQLNVGPTNGDYLTSGGSNAPSSRQRSLSNASNTPHLPTPSLPSPLAAGGAVATALSRQHSSPSLASPNSSGYQDYASNTPRISSGRIASLDDRREGTQLPGLGQLPRIVSLDVQGGRTTLPSMNIDPASHQDVDMSRAATRRSDRLPSTLHRDGTASSSTSSGSTLASSTSANSNLLHPRTPTDGFPFQRGLPVPQPSPIILDSNAQYSSISHTQHPTLSTLLSATTATKQPSLPVTADLPSHSQPPGFMIKQAPQALPLHPPALQGRELQHNQSSSSQGQQVNTRRDGESRSPSSQMSDLRPTSPLSVLLMAGQSIASQEESDSSP